MRVFTFEVVDMQGGLRVVHKALEEFARQVDIEVPNTGAGERDVVIKPRTPGKIDDDTGQRFIKGYVGMAIAAQTGLVADRRSEGLPQRDADVLDRMMIVDMG